MADEVQTKVLWARMKDDRYPVQFVAAFPEGLVEAWDEAYHEQRERAERYFRDFGDEDDVAEFFTTWERITRPEPKAAGPRSDRREPINKSGSSSGGGLS